ncbi:hypothetical protein ACFV1F_08730 [Streptomyces sp. NPDC059590]|uniref:hypothetical protein n=1 Tax=Streptomyces sp. NPDC059590 TaxID=3346877 RepID=UPI0036BCCC1F
MPTDNGLPRRAVIAALSAVPLVSALGTTGSARAADAPTATAAVELPEADAHWTFDEGSGTTAADSSGSGQDAALKGGAGWGTGKTGAHCLDLTGGGNATTTAPVLDTSKAFSVSAWVNLAQLGGYQTAVSIDGGTVSAFYLGRATTPAPSPSPV